MGLNTLVEIAFVVLALLAWWWYSGTLAREAAVRVARHACERQGLQLLDETVERVGVRLQRDRSGRVRLWRCYRFEFSGDGERRQQGEVILLGQRVLSLNLEQDSGTLIDQEGPF